MKTLNKFTYIVCFLILYSNVKQARAQAVDYPDVVVGASSTNPHYELNIAIDKTNQNNLFVCSNTQVSGSSQQSRYYCTNSWGNMVWNGNDSYPGNLIVSGDPSAAFDADGNLYMATLGPAAAQTAFQGVYLSKSLDKGANWTTSSLLCQPSFISSCTQTSANNGVDKEMIAIDNMPSSTYSNNIYIAWTEFDSDPTGSCPSDPTTGFIGFSRSTDHGATFSTPVALRNDHGLGMGVSIQTGPAGEVFACWADYGTPAMGPATNIKGVRSLDGGQTFTQMANITYTGIRGADLLQPTPIENIGPNAWFNYTKMTDFPSMAVDRSCTPGGHKGRIYVAYPELVIVNGTWYQSIIKVQYSDNYGANWTSCGQISAASAFQTFFPWVTVDDATGMVCVAYMTIDNSTSLDFTTSTHLAYSIDAVHWGDIVVSDAPHNTEPVPFSGSHTMGDYIGVAAYGGKAYVAWADCRSAGTDPNTGAFNPSTVNDWKIYVSKVEFNNSPVLYSSDYDLNVNGPLSLLSSAPDYSYEAIHDVIIPANGTSISNQAGSDISIEAGNEVHLQDGFTSAGESHIFIGTTSGCTNTYSKLYNQTGPGKGQQEISQNSNSIIQSGNPISRATENKLNLYPNPANNVININFELAVSDGRPLQFEIFDHSGNLVLQNLNCKEANQVNLSRFSDGVYTVVSHCNGEILRKSFIVQK
jgi:hypothetical protein